MRKGFQVKRYHDISCGHRVHGHESKCQYLHGHNYRIHFTCEAEANPENLDGLGRVIDFGKIKELLCMWVEINWDHKFLAWKDDPIMNRITDAIVGVEGMRTYHGSIVWLPFNPTAENMAEYLVKTIGPNQLAGTGIRLVEVMIEETAKCHASYGV